MRAHKNFLLPLIALLVFIILTMLLLPQLGNIQVLIPVGPVADQERSLIILATALMLLVVLPVFAMTFFISWKYRASRHSRYTPDWDHHLLIEIAWWAFPAAIISILAVVAWQSSHALDPFKPLSPDKKPLTIEVVALQWKWLFIYPEQNIATVNLVEFPVNTEVNFVITSDAPMNSFWIPKLGGQIYAMSGMSTNLHLKATKTGTFPGSSANISGAGFSDMGFSARSVSPQDFTNWITQVKNSNTPLTNSTYGRLSKPASSSVIYYSQVPSTLYDNVIMKYNQPASMPQAPNPANPNNL